MIVQRKITVVANWKMHKTPKEAQEFVNEFFSYLKAESLEKIESTEIVFCVPFLDIKTILDSIKICNLNNIFVGAQNCYSEDAGAFTGEISAFMLKSVGASHVILGHSERRTLFLETDDIINKKVVSCLKNHLKVILCVGEDVSQKNSGLTKKVIETQLQKGLSSLKSRDLENIIIAYEPVWAIGASKSASVEEVGKVSNFIRNIISNSFGKENSERTSILYGGSLNPKNAPIFLKSSSIDGALVGRASLNSKDFFDTIKSAD